MIYLVFSAFLFLLFFLRYNFFRIPKRGILVLLYHRVSDSPTGTSLDKFSISLKTFERQVYTLRKKGFLCAHPGNLDDIIIGRLYLKNRYVMFTFDDGYKDNLEAARILRKYGYRGIFFISTAYIGSKLGGVDVLDEDGLKELCRMEMFLGSHSHYHKKLTKLNDKDIYVQVKKSLEILSDYQVIKDFAYPFGNYNKRVIKIIKSLGFSRAFIIGQKIYEPETQDKFTIPRAIMRRNLNNIDFYLIITRGRSRF